MSRRLAERFVSNPGKIYAAYHSFIVYESHAVKEGYIHRTLVGLDQFVNVLTGGLPDETISARSQRAANRGSKLGKFMVWWLSKIDPRHGQKAQAGDLARAEKVEDTEADSLGVKPE